MNLCPELTIQLLIFAYNITCGQTCYGNKETENKKYTPVLGRAHVCSKAKNADFAVFT